MALTILPNAGQNLLVTRDAIRNNFQTLDTAFTVNHVDYGNANQGKHNFVSMPYQTTSPATAAGEIALYSQGGVLYLQPAGQTAGHAGTPLGGTGLQGTGWAQLPSGMLFLWSGTTTTDATYGYINYAPGNPAGFPGFSTAVYSVQLTTSAGPGNPAGFQYYVAGVSGAPTIHQTRIFMSFQNASQANANINGMRWLIIGI